MKKPGSGKTTTLPPRAFVLHYHEINLKGRNRAWFENRLYRNVIRTLEGIEHRGVQRFGGRMFVRTAPDAPLEEVTSRLSRVFGIANIACAWEVEADLDAIRDAMAVLLPSPGFGTFKIDARRGTKDFPLNSQELNEQLGRFVQQRTGAPVRLEDPDLTVFLEIVGPSAWIFFERIPGAGGLPSGTGGKVVSLISGGIDSPVAAFRMMRRGCQVVFVHFHSFPHTSPESQEKVRRMVAILARHQLRALLYLVPFAEVQRRIVAYTPAGLRVVLYRRFMMRIAEEVARKERASALVTGDSLGQVASQTLENLRTVSDAVRLPIFRPLIGDDKEDITRAARKLGTYSISILPDQDCCTMFIPKHPDTMASIEQAAMAENALEGTEMVRAALDGAILETITPDFSAP